MLGMYEMANCVSQFHTISLPTQKKYRNNVEILAMMLEAVKENNGNGAARFSIMRNTSINSAQLKKYLHSLSDLGFIEADDGGRKVVYKATDRGLDFLKQYNALQRLMLGAQT